jgi:hypothetical protein
MRGALSPLTPKIVPVALLVDSCSIACVAADGESPGRPALELDASSPDSA